MGLKEELHKVEEMGHRRVLEDAIASDKHTIANGKAAEKKLAEDEAALAAAEGKAAKKPAEEPAP